MLLTALLVLCPLVPSPRQVTPGSNPTVVPGRPVAQPKCYPPGQDVTGTFYGVHTICVDATNRLEKYFIDGPPLPGAEDLPLIVLFHSFISDHLEFQAPVWGSYDFFDVAKAAGYLVMMHDGGWDKWTPEAHRTYGSPSFHKHTEAAIADVLQHFPVDRDRIYGYGFSMGGGNVMNYAARHLDPTSTAGMFAAVVQHSGSVSVPLEYTSGALPMTFWENQYGGTYLAEPFKFRRATVVDIPCSVPEPGDTGPMGCPPLPDECLGGQALKPQFSLARNLRYLPVHTFYNVCDKNELLVRSNLDLIDFMQSINGFNHQASQTALGGNLHRWDKVPSVDVLAHFAPHDLASVTTADTGGSILFTKNNDRTLFFEARRTASDDFGRLTYLVQQASNRLVLFTPSAPQNLNRLKVVLDEYSPVSGDADLTLVVDANFAPSIPLVVTGFASQPGVTKDGASSPDWQWIAPDTVEIDDADLPGEWVFDLP